MSRIDTRRAAHIVVVAGGSGSGKSKYAKAHTRDHARAMVWDVEDEYAGYGFHRVTSLGALGRALLAADGGPGRYAFIPKAGALDFEGFCRAALAWGRCTVIVEELAGVTNPGKAPPGWHAVVTRGRKYGLSVFATTQRPSESDKTIMGNATQLIVGRMPRAQDRKYMAAELDIAPAEIAALQPLRYIAKDLQSYKITRGRI